MADAFEAHAPGLDSPATRHYTITPSTTALDPRPRAIRANAAGDITIVDQGDVEITYTVTAGEILPIRAVKVTAAPAGTVALY